MVLIQATERCNTIGNGRLFSIFFDKTNMLSQNKYKFQNPFKGMYNWAYNSRNTPWKLFMQAPMPLFTQFYNKLNDKWAKNQIQMPT